MARIEFAALAGDIVGSVRIVARRQALTPPASTLSPAQRRVMKWIGQGWSTEPGAGNAVMVNGMRVCNTDTMLVLERAGLANKDKLGRWTATAEGKALASQLDR